MQTLRRKVLKAAFLFFGAFMFSVFGTCPECDAGDFSIKASVAGGVSYDDNIFLTQYNTVASFVPTLIPSVTLAYKTPIWDLTLSDTFDWWYYTNTVRGYYSNNGNLSSKLTVKENLVYFDVTDVSSSAILNPRGPATEVNLNVNRTNSNVLNAIPYIKYQFDPATAVTTGFTYTNMWYQTVGNNRDQYKGYLTLEHALNPSLNGLLGAEYLADRPETVYPDDNQTDVYTSLFYTLDPRTKLDGTFGYRWIDISTGTDYDKPEYNFGVAYQFSEKGKVQLRALQKIITSPQSGLDENIAQRLEASYGEALAVNGSVYHSKDIYFQTGQTDYALGGTAGVIYTTAGRWTYKVSGQYEKDRFVSPPSDERNVYSATAAIEYKIAAKATLSLTYNYNKSTGQIETDNYTDNRVSLLLTLAL